MDFFSKIKFNEHGLVPVIAQDFETNEVLMMAWANLEALENTIKTNKATYFSRSRQKLWCKGEESGNYQEIKEIRVDCDMDTVLYMVEQKGNKAACHTGHRSCFYRSLIDNDWKENNTPLMFDPKQIYQNK
jgi:phosphoribosyl-AMP cyclohydrolase